MNKTSEKIIKKKRQLFIILLKRTHQFDAKEHILAGQGVESTTQLTENQLDGLIKWANGLLDKKSEDVTKDIRSWRSKCLRKMQQCGVNTEDWACVNKFMLNPRVCGKHLYELKTPEELSTLHRKLHNIANNIQRKLVEERFKALNN